MRGYKTSKDYKLLKELLDDEYEIIVLTKLGASTASRIDGHYYLPYNVGLFPASESNFKKKCIEYDIEFIPPAE